VPAADDLGVTSAPPPQQPPAWGPPPPGWGPPPPGWAPGPPPPPRRKHSRWLTIGLPVGGGLVLLGGLVAVVLLVVSTVGNAIGPAQKAADAWGAALAAHRWDDAQAMLCGLDHAVTAEDIADHYGDPAPVGYEVDGIQVLSSNGQTTAHASLVLRTADGLSDREELPLLRENGTWRPCP
jgi:hypothetical protein